MDNDEQQAVLGDDGENELQVEEQDASEIPPDEPVIDDAAEDPATPEETENTPRINGGVDGDDPDQPLSSSSKMAMAEFIRASSEQLEGAEFSLLVVLQPDNVRHRVTVTALTTLGALRELLCADLQLGADLRRRMDMLGEVEAQENEAEDVSRQRHEVNRRMHPNTVSDFEVLYNELDKWRQVECRKVREQRELDPSERQRALDAILAKETKLLQTIDRLKLTATDANRKQRIEAMLQFMARPKQWQMSDGDVKEVHTPFTVRAKELMDLYHGLRTPLGSVDERLDMLLHIKWTVQEFDCALTRELVELIDREADMLSRGRKEKSLEGLRKRLTNLFLQFIETPEFNPEAAALKHASI
ncbi:hypothetical protein BBP00_00009442 [Phytophthora kernoviae]|uniref:IQ motif and ubiquitin-like domain-containing protein n=1 Tax=Phytophthora kernoviae TaxID=325452 RepID=A0A3F2RCQ6_9STRA|nr:hypothetical protein BBP00_00009442 [Phytophthora kernoviae]